MKFTKIIVPALYIMLFSSCVSENYSNGERIGLITQFSESGIIWKSWEGHLNMTQTGMNSSTPFDFSVDNDHPQPEVIKTLDSAAEYGWKVKLLYHQTFGKNWFNNRGETDHFVTSVEVLDKSISNMPQSNKPHTGCSTVPHDTIYLVIYK